jgi:hypothetical protein
MTVGIIVDGVMEGLEFLDNLLSAASTVSSAIQTAQTTGQPLNWTEILSDEATAENSVLAAIAAAKAAGK